MHLYEYKARTDEGAMVTGQLRGESKFAIARILNNKGLSPIKIEETRVSIGERISAFFATVKAEEKIMFTRQLSTLFAAGMPLLTCLETLIEQTENDKLAQILTDVKNSVEAGESFSKALSKHPSVFDELFVSMVYTGEEAGVLDETLDRLAFLLEKEEKIRQDIKTATRYPIIVIVFIVGAVVVLMTAVVPKFVSIFDKMKAELPLPTRVMMFLSNLLVNNLIFVLFAGAVTVYLLSRAVKTPFGKKIWDYLKFKAPVFGSLFSLIDLTRFSRILSVLIRSGIPILDALQIVSTIVDNHLLKEAVLRVRDHIRDGVNIADSLSMEKPYFPPMLVQMVNIGENSGAMDQMLLKIADHYDDRIDSIIKNLSTLIEPILIFGLGIVVLGIALAIFMPMWDMMSQMMRK